MESINSPGSPLSPSLRVKMPRLSHQSTCSPRNSQVSSPSWKITNYESQGSTFLLGDSPPSMSGQTISMYKNTMYVFGGFRNESSALNDLWAYDILTSQWRKVDAAGEYPSPRTSHSAVVDHDKGALYIVCGSGNIFGHTNLGDIFEYNFALSCWRKLIFKGNLITPRYGQSSIIHKGKIYVFGGTFGREFSSETFCLDIKTGTSVKLSCSGTSPSARYKHTAVCYNGKMIVFGGAERLNYQLNDCYSLDLSTYRWTCLRTSGAPPAGRFAHSTVLNGNKMLVFGGTNRTSVYNDFYVLDLETNIWEKIENCTNPPTQRYFHSSCLDLERQVMWIWAGKESVTQQVRLRDLICIPLHDTAALSPRKLNLNSPSCFRKDSTLSNDLYNLYISQEFCDVKIYCASDFSPLKCHSAILRARCARLIEEVRCADHCLELHVQKFSSFTIQLLLLYLYNDDLPHGGNISSVDYLHLMVAASPFFFHIPRLEVLCEHRMIEVMAKDNVINLLQIISENQYENKCPSFEKYLLLYGSIHFGQSIHGDNVYNVLKDAPIYRYVPPSTFDRDLLSVCQSAPIDVRLRDDVSCQNVRVVTFQFNGTSLDAHQAILAARCELFRSLSFNFGMVEAVSAVVDYFDRPLLSPSCFSFLLEYIYGGVSVLDRLTLEYAMEFLSTDVCNYFGLSSDELSHASIILLRKHNSENNVQLWKESFWNDIVDSDLTFEAQENETEALISQNGTRCIMQ